MAALSVCGKHTGRAKRTGQIAVARAHERGHPAVAGEAGRLTCVMTCGVFSHGSWNVDLARLAWRRGGRRAPMRKRRAVRCMVAAGWRQMQHGRRDTAVERNGRLGERDRRGERMDGLVRRCANRGRRMRTAVARRPRRRRRRKALGPRWAASRRVGTGRAGVRRGSGGARAGKGRRTGCRGFVRLTTWIYYYTGSTKSNCANSGIEFWRS